jgi:hypothetical protein
LPGATSKTRFSAYLSWLACSRLKRWISARVQAMDLSREERGAALEVVDVVEGEDVGLVRDLVRGWGTGALRR